ncbi:PDDEXK nuclease domain-containing protein [Microbacteriaceae bacterium 4G12]
MGVIEREPVDYAETLDALARRVHAARFTLQRRANAELLDLYWHIGDTILTKQQSSAWGGGVVTRLGQDLQAEFPTMRGLSRSNLYSMRAFAAAWPLRVGIVQQPVGQLPWTHVVELLSRVDDQALREWYAGKDVQHTWSRATLVQQITSRLHERDAAAPSNFRAALSRPDSELAHQITSDPYTLGFLGVDTDRGSDTDSSSDTASDRDSGGTPRGLEEHVTTGILHLLREAGGGLALVGRQHPEGNGGDSSVELLFFQVEQLRYVVLELRTGTFNPRDADALASSVALVDDRKRLSDRHAPTVGILLVADRNEIAIRYARAGAPQPAVVSRDELAPAEQAALPEEETLARLAEAVLDLPARAVRP